MIPVNPEAIGLFGLFATVICFGLEQLGVGVKGADHESSPAPWATSPSSSAASPSSSPLCACTCSPWAVTTASIWALSSASSACLWILVGFCFNQRRRQESHGPLLPVRPDPVHRLHHPRVPGRPGPRPLGIDLVVIDVLLLTLIPAWYTRQARPDQAGRSVQRGHRRDLRIPAFPRSVPVRRTGSPVFHSLPPH